MASLPWDSWQLKRGRLSGQWGLSSLARGPLVQSGSPTRSRPHCLQVRWLSCFLSGRSLDPYLDGRHIGIVRNSGLGLTWQTSNSHLFQTYRLFLPDTSWMSGLDSVPTFKVLSVLSSCISQLYRESFSGLGVKSGEHGKNHPWVPAGMGAGTSGEGILRGSSWAPSPWWAGAVRCRAGQPSLCQGRWLPRLKNKLGEMGKWLS